MGTGTTAASSATFGAHWQLDEVGTPSVALDSSGNGNNGAAYNVVGQDGGYTFNGTNSRVVVPSSTSLNPGLANFSFGATVVLTSPPQPVGETYDVLRKGLSGTNGGDYKFEIKNVNGKALARCVVKSYLANGNKVFAIVLGTTDLANGAPHTITCTKTSTSLTLVVDSLAPRVKAPSGGLGSVSNTADLALGAKAESSASSGFDWYNGIMTDAFVNAS